MLELLSHPAEGKIKEKKLTEHLLNVADEIANKINKKTLNLELIDTDKLVRLGRIIGLMHDLGKATVFFQKYLRGHTNSSQLTNHSLFSAVVCYFVLKEEFKTDPYVDLWSYVGFHVVYRHHGNLVAFDMQGNSCNFGSCMDQLQNMTDIYWDELSEFYSKSKIDFSIVKNVSFKKFKTFLSSIDTAYMVDDMIASDDDKIEFFFLVNFLFSVLIESDKSDAARLNNEYFKDNLDEPLIDVDGYIRHCREKDPDKFDPFDPVNALRNSFLSEIQTQNQIAPQNHFYSITAPTGIGKTFGCMAFAKKLKDQLPKETGRIIYCLPYTSIIDQNFQEFEKIIQYTNPGYKQKPTRYLLKHHCLTQKEIINRKDKERYQYKDYLDDKLLVESWQSSLIVTTFVQLFHTIIGNSNRFLKKFHNIINSIVILDEVQSINPDYYKLLKTTFKVLGERFNTYFVLVTATQPEILNDRDLVSVVQNEKYMISEPFNRVRLTVEPEIKTLESFTADFIESFQGKNCLIVMNTIKYAQQIYHDFKGYFQDYQIYCLTTRLTPRDRKNKIKEIQKHLKDNRKIIVVSTQLIEAGVDLSFQLVYRDFGPMDSIVQVAGRCNRHCEYGILGGDMILVNLDNHKIYKSVLAQYVRETVQKKSYESKDFLKLSQEYFGRFNFTRKSNEILSAILNLNYDQKIEDQIPVSDFALIEDQLLSIKVFILQTQDAQKDMITLLKIRRELKKSEMPSEKKDSLLVEMEQLKYRLNQFSISVPQHVIINYQSLLEPHEIYSDKNFPYLYFSNENQEKYIYDENLGLLGEPKIPISETLNF